MQPDAEDIAQAVATLEERIEALAESAERSRKLVSVSNLVALAGGLWFAAMVVGLVTAGAAGLVFSVTAMIGGIVLSGSSRSTLDETLGDLARAEAMRTQMIDAIAPETVREARSYLTVVPRADPATEVRPYR